MKKHLLTLFALLLGLNSLNANPVNLEKAKNIGQKFASVKINKELNSNDLQLVYTGTSQRGEACFYVFNAGTTGFVIVSADDRFRPIVGYSNEGTFATENMSPELAFYLDKIIEARTSRNVVLFDNTEQEWQSVATTGKLLSRNGGRSVDYICQTKWNQDSPYNLYAPEANGGPGGRCYAGCVATAMSQVMKRWDHPAHGTGSHSYYCFGYGMQSANFGATTYDWEHMPNRLGGATQEEIEAVALLMYHCGVSVEMGFGPDGSGASSWDVPYAIRHYFSYSNQAEMKGRDEFTLFNWQNMLKEQFDLGWPVYYSGYSDSGGHAFVCDGYDDDDLFHFNWGWGGSSDGWFVIDEIDYANWAGAVFNFVPANVYDYMPMQPENLSVEPSGDFDYSATIQWTNPTQNIHFNALTTIDKIVVTRDDEVIYTEDNVTPGANMSFTDHYMPTMVKYGVYAVVNNAKGIVASEDNVQLGPICNWTVEMSSSDAQGWKGSALSFINSAGIEIAHMLLETSNSTRTIQLPFGFVKVCWTKSAQAVEQISFKVKDSNGTNKIAFEGSTFDLDNGLFFIINNNCNSVRENPAQPENLTASVSGNDVLLTWAAPDQSVINYQVYRDNLLFDVTTNTSLTDSNSADIFHSYYVAAVTEFGESTPSNTCNIQPETSCLPPTNLRFEMTSPTKAKIMWDAPQSEGLAGYMLFRRAKGEEFKRIKSLTNTYYTDNINSREDNVYEYAVGAYYSAEGCLSEYAAAQDHPELNFVEVNKTIIPIHLNFIIHEGNVILQWQEASMADKYYIYRDGQRIGHSTETNFVDYTANSSQSYHYTVTGKTSLIESSSSNEVFIDWTTNTNENIGYQDINIFPNPTENKITIEAQGLHQVRVFNVMGQEVKVLTTEEDTVIIDLSTQPQGCYFIETTSEQGRSTNKIVKL